MSGPARSTDDRMPSAPVTSDPHPARPGGPFVVAGVALVALWSAFFAGAVLLWLRLVVDPGEGADPHGYLCLVGVPFVLVALALLWWGWRSVRALRRGRRHGWTFLLVLGGVAVAQSVMTAPAVVGAMAGTGTAGATAGEQAAGPPQGLVVGMLVAIALGLTSLVVGVLGRRSTPGQDADPVAEVSAPRPS